MLAGRLDQFDQKKTKKEDSSNNKDNQKDKLQEYFKNMKEK